MNIYHKIADQARTGPRTFLGGAWYSAGAAFAWRRSELRRITRGLDEAAVYIIDVERHGAAERDYIRWHLL